MKYCLNVLPLIVENSDVIVRILIEFEDSDICRILFDDPAKLKHHSTCQERKLTGYSEKLFRHFLLNSAKTEILN